MSNSRPPRLHVVVAHPDDETFGCGGLLLHARAVGFDTYVTCATRGEAGEDRNGRAGAELGAVRAAELSTAADLLGVSAVHLLDFADSGMVGPATPETLVGAAPGDVVAAITNSLRRTEPDVVITLDASDGHRDHEQIRDLTLQASAEAGVEVVYLSCLPQSLMQRWINRMREAAPDKQHLTDEIPLLGTPDAEISTMVDIREHRAQLAVAMAAHASQDSPYDALPDDLRDAFLDTARARRIVPAWDGKTLEHTLLPFPDGPGRRAMTTPLAPAPLTTALPGANGLARAELRRHVHSRGCWWNHLEARWICSAAHAD